MRYNNLYKLYVNIMIVSSNLFHLRGRDGSTDEIPMRKKLEAQFLSLPAPWIDFGIVEPLA